MLEWPISKRCIFIQLYSLFASLTFGPKIRRHKVFGNWLGFLNRNSLRCRRNVTSTGPQSAPPGTSTLWWIPWQSTTCPSTSCESLKSPTPGWVTCHNLWIVAKKNPLCTEDHGTLLSTSRTASRERFVSSSSLTGQNKECQNPGRDSLISSAKCTKLKNSLARMGPLPFTAGKSPPTDASFEY